MTTSASSAALSGRSTYGTRSGVAAANSYRRAGQVLHATFFGPKLPNADVENLALYYIDSFSIAGRNGIRFEHGAAVPPAPEGDEYPFCYRYALEPGRAPSPTGSRAERSHRSTGPPWARSLARRSWHWFG